MVRYCCIRQYAKRYGQADKGGGGGKKKQLLSSKICLSRKSKDGHLDKRTDTSLRADA